jgi:hypothetical protein
VKVKDYYNHRYYYYPYYYGWYSCAYGSASVWHSRYGAPVYGCSNVTVIHTTISLGDTTSSSGASAFTDSSAGSSNGGKGYSMSAGTASVAGVREWAPEAKVSSAPVLMYEISPEIVAYATTYPPPGIDAKKQGDSWYWVPGPADSSAGDTRQSVDAAAGMDQPTANSAVITYATEGRIVYLTNERPIPGYYSEPADNLFAWVPGVREPNDADRELIGRVVEAHVQGGKNALDREARKLQAGHEPPPPRPEAGEKAA